MYFSLGSRRKKAECYSRESESNDSSRGNEDADFMRSLWTPRTSGRSVFSSLAEKIRMGKQTYCLHDHTSEHWNKG